MEAEENLFHDSKLLESTLSVDSYGIGQEDLDDDWCSNDRPFNVNELIGR